MTPSSPLRPLLVGAATAAIAAVACLALLTGQAHLQQREALERQRHLTRSQLAVTAERLESLLKMAAVLSNGLAAHVAAEPALDQAGFERYIAEAARGQDDFRSVFLLRDNVLSHAWPYRDNRRALGVDLARHPAQGAAVREAMHTRAPVLDGPVALIEGGSAMILRTPVYRAGRYWGQISTLVDTARLERIVGHARDATRIALATRQSRFAVGLLAGDAAVWRAEPLTRRLRFGAEEWELAAVPAGGWVATGFAPAPRHVGLAAAFGLLCGLVGAAVLRLRQGRQRLAAEAAERERAERRLSDSETRYRAVIEAMSEGVVILDDAGAVVSCNPAATRILGLDEDELLSLALDSIDWEAVDEERRTLLRAAWPAAVTLAEGRAVYGRVLGLRTRPDAPLRWLAVNSVPLRLDGRRAVLTTFTDLSEVQREAQERRALLDGVAYAVVATDETGVIRTFNPAAEALFGVAAADAVGRLTPLAFLGRGELAAYCGRADPTPVALLDAHARETGARDWRYRRPDGRVLTYSMRVTAIADDGGECLGYVGVGHDVTEKRLAERSLRLSAQVFDASSEAIVIADADWRIVSANPAFTRITGYRADELPSGLPALLATGRHPPAFVGLIGEMLAREDGWQGEVWNARKSGEAFPQWLSLSAVRDDEGEIAHYVAVFTDISRLKADEARIRFLAHYDPLTELPNRALLEERAAQALLLAQHRGHHLAVLFIDLDRFKAVNDSLGHSAGDSLLLEVARRLKRVVGDTDTVARLGGDEFIIIAGELEGREAARALAEACIAALADPVTVQGHAVHTSPSIGIALYPDDADSVADLVRHADAAMYRAKADGRNTCRFFESAMSEDTLSNILLETRLRRAIPNGELRVHYQTQHRLADGALTGYEALVRWQHPDDGFLMPAAFIPLAEETGLIVELGFWVIDAVLAQQAAWRAEGRPLVPVAVNICAAQLRRADFLPRVRGALARHGVEGRYLELEVTESMLIDEPEAVMTLLSALREDGVTVAIDDFGTGYSNMAYLKRLPIDTLKIDQSFVRDLPVSRENQAIVRAIIQLADALQMTTLAEGVENEETRRWLVDAGCDLGQGYGFARPVPAEALEHDYA
ncbi:bifunctional diguanylate cyclase/phosphodiesterase [Crenobacter luteus]|uniref:Diguanylate cyclase n=1 Tax=Crenobacter luteus TaxID=1452487 RepID=A0A163CVF4_9NEIS|nr:EAL domain-containing protein [Crenobacter luteus]KZE33266.1 hypothetical protein AVW16_08855 [Crenobacter luteus]